MTTRAELQRVTEWMSDLADLTAGAFPLSDRKEKIAAMSSAIVDRFPSGAFCRASLVTVAAECTHGFPNFADLSKHLGLWWLNHRPEGPPAIDGPVLSQAEWQKRYADPDEPAGPSPEAVEHVAKLVAAFTAERSFNQPSAFAGKVAPPSRFLSDRQLIAVYERDGLGDCARAHMLRDRLRQRRED